MKILKRVVLAVLLLIVVGALALALYIWRERAVVAAAMQIDTPNGINTLEAPVIGGVPQWVQIRGQDRGNPVLLVIHGGPGSPFMPWNHIFQPQWEKDFTVVEWDQRATGKNTIDPAVLEPPHPGGIIDMYVNDALEVTRYVQRMTGKAKIGILGHSWGTTIGTRLVREHPELFYAYVGVGQVINSEQEKATYDYVLGQATKAHDQQTLAALAPLHPYPASLLAEKNFERRVAMVTAVLQPLARYGGDFRDPKIAGELMYAPLYNPAYTVAEFWRFARRDGLIYVAGGMIDEMMTADVVKDGLAFQIPMFFFEGRHDHSVDATIVAKYFPQIEAPHKELVWFESSGHFPMLEEQVKFRDMLVEKVRPFGAQ
jgi:pimeloyl-ACP methyl ester carboxylesterase